RARRAGSGEGGHGAASSPRCRRPGEPPYSPDLNAPGAAPRERLAVSGHIPVGTGTAGKLVLQRGAGRAICLLPRFHPGLGAAGRRGGEAGCERGMRGANRWRRGAGRAPAPRERYGRMMMRTGRLWVGAGLGLALLLSVNGARALGQAPEGLLPPAEGPRPVP